MLKFVLFQRAGFKLPRIPSLHEGLRKECEQGFSECLEKIDNIAKRTNNIHENNKAKQLAKGQRNVHLSQKPFSTYREQFKYLVSYSYVQ